MNTCSLPQTAAHITQHTSSEINLQPVTSSKSAVTSQPNTTLSASSHNVDSHTSHNTEHVLMELVKSLTDQVNLSRLPAPEPNIFTGDPLKYPGWKSDFTMLI